MSSNVVCLYHDDCFDGLGAAWVVSKRFPEATFIPVRYNEPPPPDLGGKIVYIVDFCYSLAILFELASSVQELHVYDHHKGMQQTIAEFNALIAEHPWADRVEAVFDITVSGALLTWQQLMPEYPPPLIIRHISDRDLWTFTMPDTKEVMAGLGSYRMDLKTWDRLFQWHPTDEDRFMEAHNPHHLAIDHLTEDGRVVLRKQGIDIDRLIALATRTITLGDYTVPLVNVPRMLVSETLEQLALGQPFAVGYFDTATHREYSLRSTVDVGVNLIPIAKANGGNGHPHAAGFRVPRTHPLAQV